MNIIENIKDYLSKNNITQNELADRSGIHFTVISDIFKGKRPLTETNIVRLVRVGVLDPDVIPEINNSKNQEAKKLYQLESAGIELPMLADSAISLVEKGLSQEQASAVIRALA